MSAPQQYQPIKDDTLLCPKCGTFLFAPVFIVPCAHRICVKCAQATVGFCPICCRNAEQSLADEGFSRVVKRHAKVMCTKCNASMSFLEILESNGEAHVCSADSRQEANAGMKNVQKPAAEATPTAAIATAAPQPQKSEEEPVWESKDPLSGEWVPYDAGVSKKLEQAYTLFTAGSGPAHCDILIQMSRFIVDFNFWEQQNMFGGRRQTRRRVKPEEKPLPVQVPAATTAMTRQWSTSDGQFVELSFQQDDVARAAKRHASDPSKVTVDQCYTVFTMKGRREGIVVGANMQPPDPELWVQFVDSDEGGTALHPTDILFVASVPSGISASDAFAFGGRGAGNCRFDLDDPPMGLAPGLHGASALHGTHNPYSGARSIFFDHGKPSGQQQHSMGMHPSVRGVPPPPREPPKEQQKKPTPSPEQQSEEMKEFMRQQEELMEKRQAPSLDDEDVSYHVCDDDVQEGGNDDEDDTDDDDDLR